MALTISINQAASFTVNVGVPGPTGPAGPVGPAGPTFTGGPITSPITYTVGNIKSVFENGDIYAENTASGAYAVVYVDGLESSDGTKTLAINSAGITFNDATFQATAFPGFAGYATESFVTSQGYLTDAPSDGSQYARQDGAWAIVSGGGGSFLPLAGGAMDADATIALEDTVIGTVSEVGGYGMAVSSATVPASLANVLFDRVLVKTEDFHTTVFPAGIEFSDATFQTTAAFPFNGGEITGPITMDGATTDTEMSGELFGVQISADHTKGTTVEFDGLNTYDGASQMQVNPTGLIFPDASVQSVAFPGFTGYATETFVTSQGYITASALSPYLTSATAASTYQTLSGMSSYLTTSAAASTYQTLSGMSSYLTTSAAASTYAITSRGLPASGTAGQVLTKVNGTDYNATWSTIIPGDRYLTTSTTSNTVSNGAKTFTVGTGLSYTTQQDVTIANDASHHMHALVTSYNSGTGVLVVDVQQHTGTGTFTSWTVNVGGTVPLASVVWGDITGTLGNQTDLANALNAKLELSGGAMTGAITNTGAVYSCEITDAQILVNTNSSNDQAYHAANGFFTSYNQATSSGSTLRQVWIDNEGLSNTQAPLGDVGGHNVFIKPTIFSSAVYSPSETTESFQITKDGILCQRLNPAGGGYQTIQFSNAGLLFSDGTTQTTAYTGGTPSVAWGSITGSLSSQTDVQSAIDAKWTYSFSQIAGDLTQGTSYSGVIGSPPSGGKVLGFNGYYNAMEWIANPAPSSSEAVWIYGGWQSASIKNVLDMGSYSYYNVLTF